MDHYAQASKKDAHSAYAAMPKREEFEFWKRATPLSHPRLDAELVLIFSRRTTRSPFSRIGITAQSRQARRPRKKIGDIRFVNEVDAYAILGGNFVH